MRGPKQSQEVLFAYVSPETTIPASHPIRQIRRVADQVLQELSKDFDAMYSESGRPSIPPEALLKGSLLMALYSISSERLFCEQLGYNLLFKYFLNQGLNDPPFDHSTFSKNRGRLLEHEIGRKFFQRVLATIKQAGLVSDEHFTVDGTLIEAWASMKSFKPKDQNPADTGDGSKNPTVDFRGETRSNDTHRSTTDPDARLLRKAKGQAAKLCHALHLVTENRHGFIADLRYALSVGTTESDQALDMIKELKRRGFKLRTVGADKGYHNQTFVGGLRRLKIKPHVACKKNTRVAGIDGRTTRHRSYLVSQIKRKLIEQFFGWLKTRARGRKTMLIGLAKNLFHMQLRAAAYNILRFVKLKPAPPMLAGA
jgi:transposase